MPAQPPPIEFQECLRAARAGDEAAWRALFDLIAGRVAAFMVSRGAPDPEGAAGDTFLDVVRSIHRFHGDARDFVGWSLTIAHRRLVDTRRSAARRLEVVADPSTIDAPEPRGTEEAALGLVEAAEARSLFERLTPDQADVLALRIYGELTLPEIARHLGKPLTAVTSLQHRGLERLRRLLP